MNMTQAKRTLVELFKALVAIRNSPEFSSLKVDEQEDRDRRDSYFRATEGVMQDIRRIRDSWGFTNAQLDELRERVKKAYKNKEEVAV